MAPASAKASLTDVYDALMRAYGPQGWWPAETLPEVVIGAVLTQNTAWSNVEKSIASLKAAGACDLSAIHHMPAERLCELVRSSGTFRVKASRLKALAAWVMEKHGGDLAKALAGPLHKVRESLLAIGGIGPETADAILLYAGGRTTFVVDAYTRRMLRRHGYIDARTSYDDVKRLVEGEVPMDATVYNEFHALIVAVGKLHCRTNARCAGCPLERFPHDETL